jgi:hypothetical protein
MTAAGKLTVGADGKVTGPAAIVHNDPFPCVNGTPGGGSPHMMGLVMHTEDGYEQGTIATFNDPAKQVSAFFSIGADGTIHQYGPVGKNWMAWAQAAGNPDWYSIEDSDNTHPSVPLTDAQVTAFAQVLECVSAFAGFPLQISDSVSVQGLGWHGMGGAAWGNHPNCPGDVRKAQRPAIIALAREIRAGVPAQGPYRHVAQGESLTRIAERRHTTAQHLLDVTMKAYTPEDLAQLADATLYDAPYYTSNP